MEKLTKDEKKVLRKIEWEEKLKKEKRNALIKKIGIWGGGILIIVVSILALIQLANTPTINTSIKIPEVSAKDVGFGNPKAKVVLVEYSDFQCPSCANYEPILRQLRTDYESKVFFIYRMFPLRQSHKNAVVSAEAAYAAYLMGKFWEMHDILFQNQSVWVNLEDPTNTFVSYAKKIGLDEVGFRYNLKSEAVKKFVTDSENSAISTGVMQTPSFFINGQLLSPSPTSYDGFKKIIDNELQ